MPAGAAPSAGRVAAQLLVPMTAPVTRIADGTKPYAMRAPGAGDEPFTDVDTAPEALRASTLRNFLGELWSVEVETLAGSEVPGSGPHHPFDRVAACRYRAPLPPKSTSARLPRRSRRQADHQVTGRPALTGSAAIRVRL